MKIIICENCNISFESKKKNRKYCSLKCSSISNNIKRGHKYNWSVIQSDYDSGMSYTDLNKKYNVSQSSIFKAIKANRFFPRTRSDAMKLYTKNNPDKNPMKNEETKKKLSDYAKTHGYGGLREGSGRGKKQWYNSKIAGRVYLRSTYEIEYAKWLDNNNIQWKQNLIKFPYQYDGKLKYYYPDFYLIDSDEYIEIKGYKTDKDISKWNQFPFKLKVLMREDLLKLGCSII